MSRVQLVVLVAAVAALSVAGGWWLGQRAPDTSAAAPAASAPAQPQILYYRNPMGLPDTSPVPKKDSMGMDYVPVYAGEAPATPGTVLVSPERVQMSGVRIAAVERAALASATRFPALLAVDESRRRAIAPRFDGWVERLHAGQIGQPVRHGEPLLRVHSPEFDAAQREYLIASRAQAALVDTGAQAGMGDLAEAALARLRHFEVGEGTLARLRRGEVQRSLTIVAPMNGVISARPVVEGARFMAGETVLEITDYTQVWAVGQVPAREAATLAVGATAHFRSDALPGREYAGAVFLLASELDSATRTLAVRVELANPDGLLRPALYGEVVIDAPQARAVLQIPRSALLDSGERQWVFVELAPGRYEPRRVQVGRSSGERVEVREGLVEGGRIVTAANFLIDAESSLQSALQAMAPRDEAGGHEAGGHEAGGHEAAGHEAAGHEAGGHEAGGHEGTRARGHEEAGSGENGAAHAHDHAAHSGAQPALAPPTPASGSHDAHAHDHAAHSAAEPAVAAPPSEAEPSEQGHRAHEAGGREGTRARGHEEAGSGETGGAGRDPTEHQGHSPREPELAGNAWPRALVPSCPLPAGSSPCSPA